MNRRSFFHRCLGFGLGLLGVKALPEKRGISFNETDDHIDLEWKQYFIYCDFETNTQIVIEDGKIVKEEQYKECPFIVMNGTSMVTPDYVIIEKWRMS